ncbi:hypothetical protein OESDEN_23561 [Oesophagostomum dentatum]|uniref:Uncharacterized protein n=1 Tax=Oesophagostomum dentatum TaxID=61180 RepID=A0A0B1RVU6_OESDE|nr:hypothetical protein OESDEN_23561 [Oesophagostomum dentatum]
MLTVAVYTALYNLLDFPAGVVPAGNVSAQDDEDLLNDSKFPIGYNPVLKTIREAAANSEGMPLSVQVVTLPYEEETCLRIMREVEKVWKEDYRKSEQVQVVFLHMVVYVIILLTAKCLLQTSVKGSG